MIGQICTVQESAKLTPGTVTSVPLPGGTVAPGPVGHLFINNGFAIEIPNPRISSLDTNTVCALQSTHLHHSEHTLNYSKFRLFLQLMSKVENFRSKGKIFIKDELLKEHNSLGKIWKSLTSTLSQKRIYVFKFKAAWLPSKLSRNYFFYLLRVFFEVVFSVFRVI